MMKKSRNKVLSIIFCAFITLWMIGTALSFCSYLGERTESINRWKASTYYSFENNTAEQRVHVSIINRVQNKIEELLTEDNLLYSRLIRINRWFNKFCYNYNMTTSLNGTVNNNRKSQDVVVRNETGQLTIFADDVNIESRVLAVSEFHQYLNSKGIKSITIITPFKTGAISTDYFGVYKNFSSTKNDELVSGMRDNGVEVIDLTTQMTDMQEDALFFKSDHHWLPQSGLWACSVLADWMNENGYSIDESYFDLNSYSIEYADNMFLGSLGRKVTDVYYSTEPFPILIPEYENEISVFNSKLNTTLSGTIQNTMYDYSKLDYSDTLESNMYDFYSYGNQGLVEIHNLKNHDNNKILVIKESFANVMLPYMSNMSEYVSAIDLRSFDGSLKKYIEQYDPDLVITIYGISGYADFEQFDNRSIVNSPFYFE